MNRFEELFNESTQDGFSCDQKKKRVGGYLLGRTLGEGSFAKVQLGVHTLTNEKVGFIHMNIMKSYDINLVLHYKLAMLKVNK